MNTRRTYWAAAVTVGLVLVLSVIGCDTKPKNPFRDNLSPSVRLTAAPVDTSDVAFYSITLNWVGFDPDGRVDHYLYAVDPPSEANSDTTWIKTVENEKKLVFSAGTPAWQDPLTKARDFHVFAIKAVDNRGAESPFVYRAFFAYTQAPTVSILSPAPSASFTWKLPPSVRFTWSGRDDDGVFTNKPVKYKFLLLGPGSEITPQEAEINPGLLRERYAPTFIGWDSTSAETTETIITNLTPGARYMFALVGFDEAGAYSPVFSLTNNMLRFLVTFAGANGPKLTIFNESFIYSYSTGFYTVDERVEVNIEVPADRPITFNWFAQPAEGALMKAYRWALDIESVSDDTPRDDPVTDVTHWSAPTLNVTSATVGPFDGGEEHRFYIEAEDNIGLKSLGIVRFLVVRPTLEKDLGIVDDTRYPGDLSNATTRCVYGPGGKWPTAAELDTFLYARGGNPWKCYPFNNQPPPPSPTGVFNGYDFDTIGTRYGAPDMTTRLLTLGKYRHIIWFVDPNSAGNTFSGTHPVTPITSLRYMAGPSRFNSIGAYANLGGKLWLAGGGIAQASTGPWNDRNNDQGGIIFADDSVSPIELAPGRFMYDLAKWRSQILIRSTRAVPVQFTGRFGDSAGVIRNGFTTRQPKYAGLPKKIEGKIPPTDPLETYAPTRTFSEFYQTQFTYEFLSRFNYVIEDVNPDPDLIDEQPTLDSLYFLPPAAGIPGPTFNAHNVVMTYYHGPAPRNIDVITSGFNLWNYNYEELVELVDFVLQDLWGIPKTGPAPRPLVTHQIERATSVGRSGVTVGRSVGGVDPIKVIKGAQRSGN